MKQSNWWKGKSNKQKTTFIISQVLFLISILALLALIFCRQLFGDEIGDAILGENIENGFVAMGNAFAYSGNKIIFSFITIFVTFIITYILDFIVRLCTNNGKKAKTVGSLIRSLVKYIAVIVDIAIILATWGVDVASIVAGLGVLTLIIGLGCQVLIQDVISGLFLVFDDYFDVGDMVIIDGFRGYVSQIGLRSIKIDDHLGNIKSINNSSIVSCVNLSREDNTVAIEIYVAYNEDPRRIEALLIRELPKLKDKIPQAITPPSYIGISNYGDSGICYKVVATCKAAYRFQLERDMKREVYLILVDNNINIPFTSLTVYAGKDEALDVATSKDVEISEEHEKKIRKPAKQAKKKNIFQHVKATYEETLEETKKEVHSERDD